MPKAFPFLLRIPPDIDRRVDICCAVFSEKHGRKMSKSSVMLDLLHMGLTVAEVGRDEAPQLSPSEKATLDHDFGDGDDAA